MDLIDELYPNKRIYSSPTIKLIDSIEIKFLNYSHNITEVIICEIQVFSSKIYDYFFFFFILKYSK